MCDFRLCRFSDKSEIEIKGISPKSFDVLLNYMYTGALNIREDNVFDIFSAAYYLQLFDENDPLVERCTKWLVRNLDSSVLKGGVRKLIEVVLKLALALQD